jgi:cytochrome c oxidase cbb3-type subunit 1
MYGGYFVLSGAFFAASSHGNVSHHQPGAIAGLASLLAWIALLSRYLAAFHWTTAPLWRQALVFGFSERLKFTNALVAHAHLAMAGFSTALGFVILQSIVFGSLRTSLEDRCSFIIWQGGTALYVASMGLLGWRESVVPGVLFHTDTIARLLYCLRLLSGILMAAVSLRWFCWSLKPKEALLVA